MKKRRQIEVWSAPNWTVEDYAWRSPCVRSIFTGENMRAVVAVDEKGKFRPGLRNSFEYQDLQHHQTIYHPYAALSDKSEAIGAARNMLYDSVRKHEELATDRKTTKRYERAVSRAAHRCSDVQKDTTAANKYGSPTQSAKDVERKLKI